MKQIKGVNLGNWLVLEKWMDERFFEGTGAEDEVWLVRKTAPEVLAGKMKQHRDTNITEQDFIDLASHGINLVRIPVPYFVFGDRPPFIGCIEYLDMAFEWAQKHGIEVLNEPISWIVYVTAHSTGKAVDKEEARGSGYVPMSFLKSFYMEAYQRLRAILPEDKTIVFHDGFRLTKWNKFFDRHQFKNVALDTHIYIFAMESFVPIHKLGVYKCYIGINRRRIERVSKHIPVIVGEWCISNKYAVEYKAGEAETEEIRREKQRRFREVSRLQLDAWSVSAGHIFWNYQLWRDQSLRMDAEWKESWDLSRCWKNGWIPTKL